MSEEYTEESTEQSAQEDQQVDLREEEIKKITGESGEKPTNVSSSEYATWKYADGIMGEGDIPDWFLADKYKSVEEQAKAANELRKKLGSKAEDAPEHYNIDVDKYGWQKDDPVLNEFNSFFKEMNLPQKDYEKILDKYHSLYAAQAEKAQQEQGANKEENDRRLQEYREQNKESISRVDNWIKNNFNEDEQKMLAGLSSTVEGFTVLNKIRNGTPKSAPPTSEQMPSANQYDTVESVTRIIHENMDKMSTDPVFCKEMETRRIEARKRGRLR